MTQTDSAETLEGRALRALFDGFADKSVRYAVLRNHEHLPDRVGSRDIDMLVHPADMGPAKAVLRALIEDMGLIISDAYQDDMFFSVWLFRRLDAGRIFTLSIDLFPGRRIYGQELYSVTEALAEPRMHKGIPVVPERFVYLDKALYHLAIGQPTHEKYDALFAQIAQDNREALVRELTPFVGHEQAQHRIDVTAKGQASGLPGLSKGQRLRMLWDGLSRRPMSGLSGMAHFVAFRLRDQLKLRGLFLSISGPDGAGKTTVIDMVIAQLEAIYGKGNIHYAHFRPTMLPRIAEVAKKARAVEKVDENYDQPHRAKPSGILGSAVRLGYYWLDYMGGYMRSVRPVVKRREVMLFDRYYYDMIADSFRSRIALPMPLLRFMGAILPLPQFAFFIHVDSDEIHRRKQELTMERIVELNARYVALADRGWLTPIDNNGAPEVAAAAIVDTLVDARDTRARKALR